MGAGTANVRTRHGAAHGSMARQPHLGLARDCQPLMLPVLSAAGIAALEAGPLPGPEWRWVLVSITLAFLFACYAWIASLHWASTSDEHC